MTFKYSGIVVSSLVFLMSIGTGRSQDPVNLSPGTVPAACEADLLHGFMRSNAGRTVRRLPVSILPENVFLSFSSRDFAEGMTTFDRMLDEVISKSTYNCITLTLRCNPELGDEETMKAAKRVFDKARAEGVKTYMDTDPRIARREFFKEYPSDRQSVVVVSAEEAKDGKASYRIVFPSRDDHMSWGSKSPYRPLGGRVMKALAVRRDAKGNFLFSSARRVETAADVKLREWKRPEKPKPGEAYTDYSEVIVEGAVSGLADGETLVVAAAAEYYSIDVFSPALLAFQYRLMERYKALGADGGMRDEWGFIPIHRPDLKTFWWSPHFESVYRAETGRPLADDFAVMAFGAKGDPARSKAIGSYMKCIFERNVEIENAFYRDDKEIFGDDVYVVKHTTWIADICPGEYFHNGLDWWAAKRDWAQSDELMPFYAVNAMAKKFGGSVWLNEGYTSTPEQNVYRVWTYALLGGRQVFHGLYPANSYAKLPWPESRIRRATDLLAEGNVTAQSRVRLLNLVTRSHPDVRAAWIFSHEGLVDWSGAGWNDHGRKEIAKCLERGRWVDAYPASEIAPGTFRIDESGYLAVGDQRYTAVVLHRLRPSEKAAFDALVKAGCKTKIMTDANADALCAFLESSGAPLQSPVKKSTKAGTLYPEPDGTLRLIDGTLVRIRADWENPCGLPIEETLAARGGSVKVSARGVAAVRFENSEVVAFAAGALRKVEGPGLRVSLDEPEDIALLKIGGKWYGVWQTSSREKPLPAALRGLCDNWVRLLTVF